VRVIYKKLKIKDCGLINWFLRQKTSNIDSRSLQIVEIQQAHKILFSLFTRYGDTIINITVIQEFVEHYPDKEYLILCPRQMYPYVKELLPKARCLSLNKRNLFDMIRVHRLLKKWNPEIGFNPWSNGLDSCYFLTYCKRFQCYKDYLRPEFINHYEVVRNYLLLPEKIWKVNQLNLKKDYKKILICPQSTDLNRSIPSVQLDALLSDLKDKYQNPEITIASMDRLYYRSKYSQFVFKKTAQSSWQFIDLVKKSGLIITADSGPLHISLAFKKDTQAYFYSTNPKRVVKSGSILDIVMN